MKWIDLLPILFPLALLLWGLRRRAKSGGTDGLVTQIQSSDAAGSQSVRIARSNKPYPGT